MSLQLKIGNKSFTISSFSDASSVYSRMRDKSGQGASSFPKGELFQNGKRVGYISYNGRIWDESGNEIRMKMAAGTDPLKKLNASVEGRMRMAWTTEQGNKKMAALKAIDAASNACKEYFRTLESVQGAEVLNALAIARQHLAGM